MINTHKGQGQSGLLLERSDDKCQYFRSSILFCTYMRASWTGAFVCVCDHIHGMPLGSVMWHYLTYHDWWVNHFEARWSSWSWSGKGGTWLSESKASPQNICFCESFVVMCRPLVTFMNWPVLWNRPTF